MTREPAREVAVAALASVAATVAMKAAVVADMATTIPKSLRDPLLQTWQLAWGAHAVVRHPGRIWDANAFWPHEHSLAFSDALIGYAPLGVVFGSGTAHAVTRYNTMFLLSYALAAFGAYLLARQLGAGRLASAVAAFAFAFAPWRLAQENHLHVLSCGAVPLSFALLLRGHGIRAVGGATVARPPLVLAGWLVAAWQISLGFSIGIPFAYALAVCASAAGVGLVLRWRRGFGVGGRRLLAADLAGGAAFVVTVAVFAAPYVAVVDRHPEAARTIDAVARYSPPAAGFVLAPSDSLVLGGAFDGERRGLRSEEEMTLSPGLGLVVLAAVGLVWGTWRRRARLAVGGFAAGAFLLALGTNGPAGGALYEALFDHAPGWDAIRTPGRLVFLVTLALSLLAATGVDSLLRRWRNGSWAAGALALALVGAVALEGVGTSPMRPVPSAPVDMRTIEAPVFFVPSDHVLDNRTMFFSIDGFPPLVNGNSGFTPRSLQRLRTRTVTFPDEASITALCAAGVRTVVVPAGWFAHRPLDDQRARALGLTRGRARGATALALACAV